MDEQQQKKYVQMTQTPVSRLIPRLALPCIISMLVTAFYNMADTFFVGMLKSNAATGAVGVVFSLMAIIQAIGFFFGQGSGNFMSRAIGQKNYEEASDMASTGFFSALAAGVLICALGLIFLKPLASADLICVQRGPEKVSAGLLTIPSVAEIGPCAVRLLQKAVDQLID